MKNETKSKLQELEEYDDLIYRLRAARNAKKWDEFYEVIGELCQAHENHKGHYLD